MIDALVFFFKYKGLGGGSFLANGRTLRQHLSNPKFLQQIKQWFSIGCQDFDPMKSRTQIGHKILKSLLRNRGGLFFVVSTLENGYFTTILT